MFLADPDAALKSSGLCLLLEIDPERYLFPLLRSWPTPSRTMETLLVRKRGDVVQFVSPLRHRPGPVLGFQIPLGDPYLPAAMALRGEEGVVEANEGFSALVGYDRDELLGVSTRRFYQPAADYVRVGRGPSRSCRRRERPGSRSPGRARMASSSTSS